MSTEPAAGHFEENYPQLARPVPGAVEVLERLRDYGLHCVIVSNGEGNIQRRKIAAAGLSALVDFIIISSEVGVRKPDWRIFHLAADSVGLSPDECLFVGDNPEADIIGATRAGMKAIYFGNLADWPAASPFPSAHCDALPAVLELCGIARVSQGGF